MDPARFFAASRLVIVAGKGGVGKTTVTSALARAAAHVGFSVLMVEVEANGGLGVAFDRDPFTYDATPAGDGISGRAITPDVALVEYLEDNGLTRLSRRLVNTGAIDVVATGTPGIKDIVVLGKVKQLERAGGTDLLVLDAPAAGHAISFLHSARGVVDSARSGPINAQARDVLEMLTDPSRCSVVLVTWPEETPVNEAVETAYQLEDRVGVALGPIVVNGLYPPLDGLDVDPVTAAAQVGATLSPAEAEALARAAEFRRRRMAGHDEQVARLAAELPLPQIRLPFLFRPQIGAAESAELARALLGEIEQLPALELS